ncbi:tetratricopeptide repeat protein [Magnetospirillum sp. 64-120]|uniref:tetratricopeptide repeat protein n=1 Tax=Magnetospirillum sp. 64-120 TaxID=1895778 RepID=UPI000928D9A8|nr:tetratricopeptide repeat protein [Magnetospirillum sp. 64-120]OJX79375.1 MAG: hypothetical protein BGO92_12895 [Magnetospirillum sp. 64-120]
MFVRLCLAAAFFLSNPALAQSGMGKQTAAEPIQSQVRELKAEVLELKQLKTTIEHQAERLTDQNTRVDNLLTYISWVGGIVVGLLGVVTALVGIAVPFWVNRSNALAVNEAKSQAKSQVTEQLKEAKDNIEQTKADVEQAKGEAMRLLDQVRGLHRDATGIVDEMRRKGRESGEITPEQQQAVQTVAHQASQKPPEQRSKDEWWALAQQALNDGDITTAEDFLDKAQDDDQDNPWTWVLLARLHVRQGNLTSARHAAEKALSMARQRNQWIDEIGARIELGDIARSDKQPDEAMRIYTSVEAMIRERLKMGGDIEDAKRALLAALDRVIMMHLAANSPEKAKPAAAEQLSLARQLFQADSGESDRLRYVIICHNNIGKIELSLGHLDEAEQAFQTAFDFISLSQSHGNDNPRINADTAEIIAGLAAVLSRRKQYEAAKREFSRAISILEDLAKAQLLDSDGIESLEEYRRLLAELNNA